MEMEQIIILMVINILGNLDLESLTVMENIFGKMEIIIKVIFMMGKSKDSGNGDKIII